jgi:hypothetical protein
MEVPRFGAPKSGIVKALLLSVSFRSQRPFELNISALNNYCKSHQSLEIPKMLHNSDQVSRKPTVSRETAQVNNMEILKNKSNICFNGLTNNFFTTLIGSP